MALTEGEQELADGLSLVLTLLEARLGDNPLTTQELADIAAFKAGCWIHVRTALNCKYCEGVVVTLACHEGEEGLLSDH